MVNSVKDREASFHNAAFSEGTRSTTEKFYSIFKTVQNYYNQRLECLTSPRTRALEIGCGPGSASFFLAKHHVNVVGIDISKVAIEQATEQAARLGYSDLLRYRMMDAERLEFAEATFDLVCGSGILHHLDLDKAYGELSRVLAPDGTALFVEPLGHNPLINCYRAMTPGLRTVDEHPLLRQDIDKARRVFSSVRLRYFHLSTLACIPLRNTRAFGSILRRLDAFDNLLFRAIPPAALWAWTVVLELKR